MSKISHSDWVLLSAAAFGAGLRLLPGLALVLFVTSHKARLFGTADDQLVARQLLAGQDFYGSISFDERSFQATMARGWKAPIDVLIAGSSRTMQLEADCFDGPSYNASESAAMISDFTAVLEQFRRGGHHFKQVIFAADPWLINEYQRLDVNDLVRIPAAPDWVRAQLRLGLTPRREDWIAAAKTEFEPLRQALAPASYQSAWKIVFNGRPVETQERKNLFRKTPDGSLRFPDFIADRSGALAAESALDAANGHLPTVYGNFTKFDPLLRQALETLLADVKSSGARVTLFLAPFHPVYYDRVVHSGGGRMLPVVEAYFRDLAKQRGYDIIGTYDPAGAGSPATDFFDGVHLKQAPLKRLFGCPQGRSF